ncbi:TIR domain-containing protein [Bradyrhizobium canariense]|uniref:TIR domain-containing protein n=1 Tax=Bradyrhizobium canariense TaxID=255045 RepID=UPI001C668F7B|nr:nucleotide-binding protein [Bradyrhizobium canariense]
MATRNRPPQPQPAYLTPERMRQGLKRLEAALKQVTAFDPNIPANEDTVKADRLAAAVEAALTQTFGHGTVEFQRYSGAAHFSWPLNYAYPVPLHEIQESLRRCRNNSIGLLQEAMAFLTNELDLLGEMEPVTVAPAASPAPLSKHVVIGHGRSPLWRELRDFLRERLGLSVDEFNAVSTAGLPTVARLEEMLAQAGFAFLVMTAEDQQADGSMRARENVVHEVGLFQGKLGFRRAIILLEDGCEEFSNIHGLGQIRFQRDNLSARFEEIRRVLEREGFLKPT